MSEMPDNEFLFTSQSATEGHPDKVADQISDGVLDAVMRDAPTGRVACATLGHTGPAVVPDELSPPPLFRTNQHRERPALPNIGYNDAGLCFPADSCAVINAIDKQSPDIAQ